MSKNLSYLKRILIFLHGKKVYLRVWAFPITKFLVNLHFKIVSDELKNVIKISPALVVANHCSYIDVLIIGTTFYNNLVNLRWVISKENYRLLFLKWFYALYPVIVVNGTVEKAVKELNAGRWVVIFPEGGRKWLPTKEVRIRKIGTGTAAIALVSGVPIIPVHISGSDKVLAPSSFKLNRAHTITVRVGEPFSFESVAQEKMDSALLEKTTEEIVRRIYALIPH